MILAALSTACTLYLIVIVTVFRHYSYTVYTDQVSCTTLSITSTCSLAVSLSYDRN